MGQEGYLYCAELINGTCFLGEGFQCGNEASAKSYVDTYHTVVVSSDKHGKPIIKLVHQREYIINDAVLRANPIDKAGL